MNRTVPSKVPTANTGEPSRTASDVTGDPRYKDARDVLMHPSRFRLLSILGSFQTLTAQSEPPDNSSAYPAFPA
eukprot:5050793-Ditylum_brightwellii.AAC.1